MVMHHYHLYMHTQIYINSHLFLSVFVCYTDKTIKLWKVYEKQAKKVSGLNLNGSLKNATSVKELKVPRVAKGEKAIAHLPKKIYGSAHAYHINSISLNSDGETFISADDLRINLWHANYTKESHSMSFVFNFALHYCC